MEGGGGNGGGGGEAAVGVSLASGNYMFVGVGVYGSRQQEISPFQSRWMFTTGRYAARERGAGAWGTRQGGGVKGWGELERTGQGGEEIANPGPTRSSCAAAKSWITNLRYSSPPKAPQPQLPVAIRRSSPSNPPTSRSPPASSPSTPPTSRSPPASATPSSPPLDPDNDNFVDRSLSSPPAALHGPSSGERGGGRLGNGRSAVAQPLAA